METALVVKSAEHRREEIRLKMPDAGEAEAGSFRCGSREGGNDGEGHRFGESRWLFQASHEVDDAPRQNPKPHSEDDRMPNRSDGHAARGVHIKPPASPRKRQRRNDDADDSPHSFVVEIFTERNDQLGDRHAKKYREGRKHRDKKAKVADDRKLKFGIEGFVDLGRVGRRGIGKPSVLEACVEFGRFG